MPILLISDLHLDPVRPRITRLFLKFLETQARSAAALYILGDFFEAWIGDDDTDPHQVQVMVGVRALTDSGVPVYFMHGNRDFLIGDRFAANTGCHLLADPTVVNLHERPTLLMHGDTLCTDDAEYQAFRRQVHQPIWQEAFLAKPLAERRAFAAHARTESQTRNAVKPGYLMDVNQQAVKQTMTEHGVTRLIHGHTHRPAVHRFTANGQELTRIVLGDWYEQPSVLVITEGAMELRDVRCTQSIRTT